jgi:hypothetical protein
MWLGPRRSGERWKYFASLPRVDIDAFSALRIVATLEFIQHAPASADVRQKITIL